MFVKQSRNLGTDDYKNNYKNNGHNFQEFGICIQKNLFEHFLRRNTTGFFKMCLLHWLTKLTRQTLWRDKILEKYSSDNESTGLNIDNFVWNNVLLYSCHCTDGNNKFIYERRYCYQYIYMLYNYYCSI